MASVPHPYRASQVNSWLYIGYVNSSGFWSTISESSYSHSHWNFTWRTPRVICSKRDMVISYLSATSSSLRVLTSRDGWHVCPCEHQPKNSWNIWVWGQYQPTLKLGKSGSLFWRDLQPFFNVTQSVCCICISHITAFFLYLLLQVYLPVGMSPIVLGFRNRLRRILLQADAFLLLRQETLLFPICLNSRLSTRHAWLNTVTSSWK